MFQNIFQYTSHTERLYRLTFFYIHKYTDIRIVTDIISKSKFPSRFALMWFNNYRSLLFSLCIQYIRRISAHDSSKKSLTTLYILSFLNRVHTHSFNRESFTLVSPKSYLPTRIGNGSSFCDVYIYIRKKPGLVKHYTV